MSNERIVILTEEEAVWLVGDLDGLAARGLIRESIQAKLWAALQGDGGVTEDQIKAAAKVIATRFGFESTFDPLVGEDVEIYNESYWRGIAEDALAAALQVNTPSEPSTANADRRSEAEPPKEKTPDF